jgi:hypothetical protein
MVRLQTIFESNDSSIVAIKEPTTAITRIGRHSFERIGNRLCFSLHVQPIADFNSQKYEEDKGLKGCTPEVHYNVPINHQGEDTGSDVMGFPFFCAGEKKLCGRTRF